MQEYIDFERQDDALTSLSAFCLAMEQVDHDLRFWKLAIVSIHNALQSFICISIRNGNSLLTIKKNHLKKWLKAHEGGKNYPETQLDYFMELYDKRFAGVSGVDRNSIDWLNNTRNSFAHFNTDNFSMCRLSAHQCCGEALKAILKTNELAEGILSNSEKQKDEFHALYRRAESLLKNYSPA